MTDKLRLAFMGSPDFAVPVAVALQAAGHDIVCVYSQPPRRSGRGKKLQPTPVHAWAEAEGIEVRTPRSLKAEAEQAAFAALKLDAAVVVAYGLILPQAILDAPRLGCMNMHASLLPRWRGAAPIQRAIMAGDSKTGVQAMMMEAGLDTGPVLASLDTEITATDTAGSLHHRLADGSLVPQPQAEAGVTYAHKLGPDDQLVDWSQPASVVDCQVRGLSPFPGAYCWYTPQQGEPVRLKVLDSRVIHGASGMPGTVVAEPLHVACGGDSVVELLSVQKPGAKALPATEFLRGFPVPIGSRLR